jgi:hypothetical protein
MDRLYSTPSWQLAITLFVILLGGMFVGFLLGKNAARHGEPESGAADSAVKGAVAGLRLAGRKERARRFEHYLKGGSGRAFLRRHVLD